MSLQAHIQRRDNPHGHTLESLGLDEILPYPIATRDEVIALSRDDRYVDTTAVDWIKDAFTQYLIDLGLADQDGNLHRRDISTNLYAHIDEQDQLIISGTALGGRKADYVIQEDGQEFMTGSFNFVDHYYEVVSGQFSTTSVYKVILTVYNEDNIIFGDGEVIVFDTRSQDEGYYGQNPEGFLYYDQRYFDEWGNLTNFTDLDAGNL